MGWGGQVSLQYELNLLGRPCWVGWVIYIYIYISKKDPFSLEGT